VSASTKSRSEADSLDYPRWWDFDEDGDELIGTFLRAGRGFTANGERTFVVLDVDGTERTCWLHHKVLAAAFAREVQRRPAKQIELGELIEVRRLGEREGGNGRSYTNYRVTFPDGPQDTQESIFGMPPELAGQASEPAAGEAATDSEAVDVDGDIPF
jgi:hypothetical protein